MTVTRSHARTAATVLGRVTWWTLRTGFTVLAWFATVAFHYVLAADDELDERDGRRDSDPFDSQKKLDEANAQAWAHDESVRLRKKSERR